MKKSLTTPFQTQLWEAVKAIERNSQAEVVVVIRSHAANYHAIPLAWGAISAWLMHTYIVFAPEFFPDWWIYCAPMLAFTLFYGFAHLPWIIRLSSRRSSLQKNVEIMARALFQKGGIHQTRGKIGLLIYCSELEKLVYLLPDSGLEIALPVAEWQNLRTEFQQIFNSRQPHTALLAQLEKTAAVFSRYLPAQANAINELPDDMDIDL
jgi:putative membrane protein